MAKPQDLLGLQNFFKTHWKADHAFVQNKELLMWQHQEADAVHFLLAKTNEKEIVGILGFIPTWKFDSSLSNNRDMWLVNWMVPDVFKIAGLGMKLLFEFQNRMKPTTVSAMGVNQTAKTLYRACGFDVGIMKQYFKINPKVERPVVAQVSETYKPKTTFSSNTSVRVQQVSESELNGLSLQGWCRPIKSPNYFVQRYIRHPFYRYEVFLVSWADAKGIIATREIELKGVKILRVVDFLGGEKEDLGWLGEAAQNLLVERGYEYVDFMMGGTHYNVGPLEDLDEVSGVVIPNYFEPFEQRKVDVHFAVKKSKDLPYVFVKGDSDQDRPSHLS